MFQLIRNRHSGNMLKILFHKTELVKRQGYIKSNSTARVLPDNVELEDCHQLETGNTLTKDNDNLMNHQHSEQDNNNTTTTSSDEWNFLFEVVEEKEDNYNKKQYQFPPDSPIKRRQSLREDFDQKSQRQFIPYEKDKDDFRKIFRTLLDSKNHEHSKDSKLKEKSKSRQKLLTIEKHLIDLMHLDEERRLKQENENKWIKEHFDSIPNESKLATKSSLPKILKNIEPEDAAVEEIKDELLKCETKKQLQEFISKNIFGIEIDNKKSVELKRVVDDFNRPFPFKYAMLLKQSILICKKIKEPYLALSIFEQTKRRGLLSYLLGCTTEIYNQIILIRWEFWKDLKGIESLLNEMIDNKISFDKETSDIIDSIELEVISYNNSKRWDSFDKRAYNNILNLTGNWIKRFQILKR
ncbi:hypothetical protein C1645_830814 [Glomus cerebriforme]|uniref:Mtf2-like C-terminal domain-containing protein n=1 Tax=Glomus cerebriforme TaxID=658196 RepID=A0A397SKJ3_9GLOM|nr:hypothetical protein C1645_830814 [Glomus cerebriforme]